MIIIIKNKKIIIQKIDFLLIAERPFCTVHDP